MRMSPDLDDLPIAVGSAPEASALRIVSAWIRADARARLQPAIL